MLGPRLPLSTARRGSARSPHCPTHEGAWPGRPHGPQRVEVEVEVTGDQRLPAPTPFLEALSCVTTSRCQLPRPSSLRLKGVPLPRPPRVIAPPCDRTREGSEAKEQDVGIRVLSLPFWRGVASSTLGRSFPRLGSGDWRPNGPPGDRRTREGGGAAPRRGHFKAHGFRGPLPAPPHDDFPHPPVASRLLRPGGPGLRGQVSKAGGGGDRAGRRPRGACAPFRPLLPASVE